MMMMILSYIPDSNKLDDSEWMHLEDIFDARKRMWMRHLEYQSHLRPNSKNSWVDNNSLLFLRTLLNLNRNS